MFRYLVEERGLRRLAIAHDPNAYGAGFRDRLQAHAPRFGYTFAGALPIVTRRPGDLSAELTTLTTANPDAIVMALYPEQAQALMAARAQAGWGGRMVSTGPLTDEASLAVPGGSADGTLGFCHYPDPERSDVPGVVSYRAALSRLRPGRAVDRYTLYGYTFGRLVVEGARRAGRALTRERFIDAMEAVTDWDAGGVMPNVSFSALEPSRPAGRLHLRDARRSPGRRLRLDRAVTSRSRGPDLGTASPGRWQDGHGSQRRAAAAADLHRQGDDRRASQRQALQGGEVLERRHVRGVEHAMRFEAATTGRSRCWRCRCPRPSPGGWRPATAPPPDAARESGAGAPRAVAAVGRAEVAHGVGPAL